MEFEVFRKPYNYGASVTVMENGKPITKKVGLQRIFYTEHESCIPPIEHQLQMVEAGYVLKLDGKLLNPKQRKKKGG